MEKGFRWKKKECGLEHVTTRTIAPGSGHISPFFSLSFSLFLSHCSESLPYGRALSHVPFPPMIRQVAEC